jgi:hypothetical protein
MRLIVTGILIAVAAPSVSEHRAGIRAPDGAVTSSGADQQAALRARRSITHPDSIRRWRDAAARDTTLVRAPAEFLVDMTAGPVVVEAVGRDSIRVEAQLSPRRGPIVASWGRALRIESDGVTPRVLRRR